MRLRSRENFIKMYNRRRRDLDVQYKHKKGENVINIQEEDYLEEEMMVY